MKFMVEFRLQAGNKDKVLEAFELRGPNRNPGLTFAGAWIGTDSDVVFVLVESDDASLVAQVGQSWAEYGQFQAFPVIDVQEY